MRALRIPSSVLAALIPVGLAVPVLADTVELGSSRDTTLFESSTGSLGNGAGQYLFAGNTAQGDPVNSRRGVIAFDVAAAVPPGSTITSVSLQLRVSKVASAAPRTIGLHAITRDWGEGASAAIAGEGVGAPAEDGDATWLHTFHDTADPAGSPAWTTPGGDFVAVPSATTSVGATNQFAIWGPTSQLVADVQQWLDDPASNHGWLLLGDESTDTTAKRFNTREFGGSASLRPKLTIEFTPGAACPGDIDADGSVDFNDLLGLLSDWGGCPDPCTPGGGGGTPDTCPADTNRDCQIDFTDLLAVLAAWGPCAG
jgi:hypothetical protein